VRREKRASSCGKGVGSMGEGDNVEKRMRRLGVREEADDFLTYHKGNRLRP